MRIAIVNDMPLIAEALRRLVAATPDHHVAWVAHGGEDAVVHCAADLPDLLLMDLIMPGMNGVEATRRIMAKTPCAILLVTASIDANVPMVFEAMGYGALDAVDTPSIAGTGALLRKITAIGRLVADRPAAQPMLSAHPPLIAIGSSAGGPAALATLLAGIPADIAAALVIIQHVDVQFAAGMATWLQGHTAVAVRLAHEGDLPAPGVSLLAASQDHLALLPSGRLGYTSEPRDYVYRPSVDVFFHSVARHWHGPAIGLLLTGMGRDGAQGLKALRAKGCHTIAQDRASSAVYGMPKAAADIDAAVEILPLQRIAPSLIEHLTRPKGISR